jgi:hypothetical protein
MFYAKLTPEGNIEKYPYGLSNLKIDNPNTCFPEEIDNDIKNSYRLVEVKILDRPEYDPNSQYVEEFGPHLLDGEWVISWSVKDLSEEELRVIEENKINQIKNHRNFLLSQTDWVVIKAKETGTNLSAGFKEYRQALRDITEQEGFPHNVTWPTKPN